MATVGNLGTWQKPRKWNAPTTFGNSWERSRAVPFSCGEWHHIVLCLEAKQGRSHVCLNVCNGCNAYVTIRIIIGNKNARLTSKLRFSHLLRLKISSKFPSFIIMSPIEIAINFESISHFFKHTQPVTSLTSQPFIASHRDPSLR